MISIGLDIERLTVGDKSGINRYVVGVLTGFKAAGLASQVTLFLNRKPRSAIRPEYEPLMRGFRFSNFDNRIRFAYQLRLGLTRYSRVQVLQIFSQMFDPVIKNRVTSFLVPDLTTIHMAKYHTAYNCQFWAKMFDCIAQHAQLVLTYSEHTRQDVINMLKVPADRVVAIPLAADTCYYPLPAERVALALKTLNLTPQNYILNVGTLEPRKNHLLLFDAYAVLKSRGLVNDIPLVLAGPNGWNYDEIKQHAANLGLTENVRYLGFTDSLPELYNGAIMMVYPSFFEGFGLPPLEAMACGTPVIVSNATSLPEVVGPDGLMVDPHDVDGLVEAMSRILTDEGYRAQVATAGLKRSQHFSWQKCAQQMYSVYETAYQRLQAS